MFPWRCDNFSFDLLLHCHLATASANHISPISLCLCIFINMFLNYQKSTGNDISETVKTNTFRTLVEMRSLNRNVRPPFQETPDQPLLSQVDIMIYDVIRAPKQYFAPGPTKPLGGPGCCDDSDYISLLLRPRLFLHLNISFRLSNKYADFEKFCRSNFKKK